MRSSYPAHCTADAPMRSRFVLSRVYQLSTRSAGAQSTQAPGRHGRNQALDWGSATKLLIACMLDYLQKTSSCSEPRGSSSSLCSIVPECLRQNPCNQVVHADAFHAFARGKACGRWGVTRLESKLVLGSLLPHSYRKAMQALWGSNMRARRGGEGGCGGGEEWG